MIQKQKKSTWQSFFNFQEYRNEGKWIPSKSWCRNPGLIRCIGTFLSALTNGLFSTYLHWNVPGGTKKYLPIWRTSVDDVTASPLYTLVVHVHVCSELYCGTLSKIKYSSKGKILYTCWSILHVSSLIVSMDWKNHFIEISTGSVA
jgi:hypothetical protein